MDSVIDKEQRLSEGHSKADDQKMDFEDLTDDEEVALNLPRKGAEERDPPGEEIRDYRRENDSDGRGGPLHIRDCFGNIGREGIWRYGKAFGDMVRFDPRTTGGGGGQHGSPFPGKELLQGLEIHPCRPTWDHMRCLHGFRWCWSRRPGFGVLGDWPPFLSIWMNIC